MYAFVATPEGSTGPRRALLTLDELPCGCGKPHLGGTEHADECEVGFMIANPFLVMFQTASIGPLADGSIVAVERWHMNEVASAAGLPWSTFVRSMREITDEEVIAAFNERERRCRAPRT
jgi:hypothetical protein